MSCNCNGNNYNNNIEYDNFMSNGNSIDFNIDGCESEIKANIMVGMSSDSIRLWGQVISCDGHPVSNALLKLIRVIPGSCGCEYQGVAHTVSDCNGFYQFDLDADDNCANYKVLVGKSSTGCERVVNTLGNCSPYNNSNDNSCDNNQPYPCYGQQSGCQNNCEQCGCEQSYREEKNCGQSDCGQSRCGQSSCGQSSCGQSRCGQSSCGQSSCGQSRCGQSRCGQNCGCNRCCRRCC